MTRKLQHIFALSEKGAKDLVKAVIWCFVCNLALMFPHRGSPVYSSTPAWLSGGRRQSHGRVLALCGLRPGGAGPTVRPTLVPVRLSLHRHLPGERQPPGEPGGDPAQTPTVLFREP